MGLIDTLATKATKDVQVGEDLWFRVRLLDPVGAQHIGVLMSLLAGIGEPEKEAKTPTPADSSRIIESTTKILCGCVTHASQDGDTWEKVQLVATHKEQAPEKGLLWINVLPENVQGKLLGEILTHWKEARETIRPFRAGSESPLAPGRDSKEVSSDAP